MKPNRQRGVALVITLIFLSVITILAVAFLALSRRGRVAIRESSNRTVTEQMADIALERVKGEILLPILATNPVHSDLLGPGLRVSVNYITTNYTSSGNEDVIAGLWRDPRPPVFVNTNRSGSSGPLEFRYYLDLNRNGKFDPSGRVAVTNDSGQPVMDGTGQLLYEDVVGDPEWVGVLADPTQPHGRDNPFVGRWAYLMVPAGRTLDLNWIHNDAKELGTAGFYRNQGFGPWEINLAAFLSDLNTNYWGLYNYNTNLNLPSGGLGFADASELLNHRYMGDFTKLPWFSQLFPGLADEFEVDLIDGYADGFDPMSIQDDNADRPWPGAPNNTNFFTIHDLFRKDATPPYVNFIDRLSQASAGLSTYDRYTFYRLLAQLGTDSAPERRPQFNPNYQNAETNIFGVATNWLSATAFGSLGRTNHGWVPTSFFNSLANELIRREFPKIFGVTNRIGVTNLPVFFNGSTRYLFGTTNLPLYHPRIHQLLQLTANIHDATRADKNGELTPFLPTVFAPVFEEYANGDICVVRYEEVDGPAFYRQLRGGELWWWNLGDPNDRPRTRSRPGRPGTAAFLPKQDFFYEVPLIVGAKTGLPNFNEFVIQSDVQVNRKLEFRKPRLDVGPSETNQMFIMGISNVLAVESWYGYSNPTNYPRDLELFAAVSVSSALTNDAGFRATNVFGTNSTFLRVPRGTWGSLRETDTNRFRLPLFTTLVVLSNSVYNKSLGWFEPVGRTNTFERNVGNFTNRWVMTLTNRLLYFLFDMEVPDGPQLVDAVSLNNLDTVFDIGEELSREGATANAIANAWDNRPYGNVTVGVNNQMLVSLGIEDIQTAWLDYGVGPSGGSKLKAIDGFRFFMDPSQTRFPLLNYLTNDLPPLGFVHQAPFSPSKRIIQTTSWQVNDPLVHYTVEDLRSATNNALTQSIQPPNTPVSLTRDYNLNKVNERYRPWGGRYGSASDDANLSATNLLAIKDPGVRSPDDWDFPEQKFPNIGWLGRVHRGTPWQSVYLKSQVASDSAWLRPNGPGIDLTMHPTNDWYLLDLFTVALHPDMSRGGLSINQTNLPPWSAVLAGVPVTTVVEDNDGSVVITNAFVEPAIEEFPVLDIVEGVARTRLDRPDNQFRRLGDILAVPELTVASPFLEQPYVPSAAWEKRFQVLRDSDLERIPQQILSLLQPHVGEPRFVVYAFGQSLTPEKAATSGSYLGMPVNYRITGEMATRAVIRVDFERLSEDPDHPDYEQFDYSRPHVVVERFNVLPME